VRLHWHKWDRKHARYTIDRSEYWCVRCRAWVSFRAWPFGWMR